MKTTTCKNGGSFNVFCSHTELVLTDIIKANPRNPNKHPDSQIELLGKVIQSQGWRAPITISKRSGLIVKGHGRLAAAKLIGCEQCPVDYQEYDTEADEIADLLADNKIAELANIDMELELSAKQFLIDEDFDLELAGFAMNTYATDDDLENEDKERKELTIEEQYVVEVQCNNEQEQNTVYNKVKNMGYECRILTL